MTPPDLVKRVLYHSGLLALARLARQRWRAIVLRYHAITDGPREVLYAAPEICMPVDAFRLQMAYVRRAYRVVSMDALVDALARGGPLPPRALVLTFDDGYADNHRLALPVLRHYGLAATVYLATGSIGDEGRLFWVSAARALALRAPAGVLEGPGGMRIVLPAGGGRGGAARALTAALLPLDATARWDFLHRAATDAGIDLRALVGDAMLTWSEVRALHQAGWCIGAHTVTHPNLALTAPDEVRREIRDSRDAIAEALAAPVRHFCYPNTGGTLPYYGPALRGALAAHGFVSAVTSRPGAIMPGLDPFFLPRLGVGPRLTAVPALATAVERRRLAA